MPSLLSSQLGLFNPGYISPDSYLLRRLNSVGVHQMSLCLYYEFATIEKCYSEIKV